MEKSKYDIGLLTCGFSQNFGALFTAYSLYLKLKEMGYSVLFLDKPKYWYLNNCYGRGYTKNRSFLKKHIKDFSPEYTKEEIVELNDRCNTFIVGSDQLWNYVLYEGTGHLTAFDFVNDERKKISYATSFGHDVLYISGKEKVVFGHYLHRFDAISVREKSGVELLKKEYGLDAEWVLDPVFLVTTREYDLIASESKRALPKDKYIFSYILDPTEQKIHSLKQIAKDNNLKVILFAYLDNLKDFDTTGIKFCNIGSSKPEDWLKLLKHSSLVYTDSFHGMCFSLIYNKKFICIKNKGRGEARFQSLINQFNIKENGSSVPQMGDLSYAAPSINYKLFISKVEQLRTSSVQWLKEAIDNKKVDSVKSNLYKGLANTVPDIITERRILTSIRELGFVNHVSIKNIVERMPLNCVLYQSQGKIGDPIEDTPLPFGVLTVVKTTNYFVQISFTRMTIGDEQPTLYIAKWINGNIISWSRMVDEGMLAQYDEKLIALQKQNEESIRSNISEAEARLNYTTVIAARNTEDLLSKKILSLQEEMDKIIKKNEELSKKVSLLNSKIKTNK